MARATPQQSSFLGGEWTPIAAGRTDDPRYTTALEICLNTLIAEEGAVVRRPGTMRIAPTYGRGQAKILEFVSSAGCPFVLEITNGSIRMYDGASLVFTNDPQVITNTAFSAGFITLTTTSAHGWSVGDQFQFNMTGTTDEGVYRGFIFKAISGTTGSTVVLGDDLGNALPTPTGFVNGTTLNGATLYRVKRFDSTGYTTNIVQSVRLIQAQLNAILLTNTVKPQVVTVNEPPAATEATFTFGALGFVDGPYLDPAVPSLSMSAITGSGVTLTAGSASFTTTTDVGRHVRIFTQPPAYNPVSTYTAGQQVTDSTGAWWTALTSVSAGQAPGQIAYVGGVATVVWAPAPTAGSWAWGKITAVADTTHATFTFDTTIPGMVLNSGNGTTASAWRLGVFSDTTGYPTCGAYYEGRIWFMGSVPNRFDASVSNGMNALTSVVTFSPTDPNGNVLDSSGISEILNSKTVNIINWGKPDPQGLVMGTGSGEWLVAASNLNDPITPTSIQAHQVTSYRSEAIEPAEVPMATIFAQQYGRRIMEYLSDAFTQRYTGETLNEYSRHQTVTGVSIIKYQTEPIPIVWAVTNDGQLLGCTYRRISRFVTEKPALMAWHRHKHGGGLVTGLAVVPNSTGVDGDRCYIVVHDALGYSVELLQPSVEIKPITSVRDGWFVDSAPAPTINVVGKCGFLYPSGGYRLSSSFTPSDWSDVTSLPDFPVLNAGDTIPSSGGGLSFDVLNKGCYLNGYSAMLNFGGAKNITGNYTISVWFFIVGDGGSLFNTDMANSGFQWEQNQILGQGIGPPELCWALAHNGAGVPWSDTIPAGISPGNTGGGWLNLQICASSAPLSNGDYVAAYANNVYLGGFHNVMDFVNSLQGPISVSTSTLVFGGCRQLAMSANQSNFIPTQNFGAQLPVNGYGMTAGVAELWASWGHCIDFTVGGNRALFHATDLTTLKFAPVKLGKHGELPLGGTRPNIYCSGSPKYFRINRANGLQVTTINTGGNSEIVGAVDPAAVMLDPLPPFIAPVS